MSPKKTNHEAPLTGPESTEPHSQDLAPSDISIKPTPEPTPPGAEPMAAGSRKTPDNTSEKSVQLDEVRVNDENWALTTNQGIRIADNQNSLTVGNRGATLLEDFILREKITHFDHERIPERIVHARGAGAHGYFQVYESLSKYTKAAFLQDPKEKTPVFVRFSTVQGSRGSADTARDIRGFATKFYTQEGVFDLVGNNTPIFFIHDAIKFPDFVHAVKPEPHNEIPQAQSAHDTFWDFVSLQPESLHNVMWAMSDRAIPRSYRMMEGFGIHTFRLVNADGVSHFVRFHWKPVAGTRSLVWDEAQLLMGRDPDFHRRDLWEAIEAGDYVEFELGLQIIPEEDEHRFDFDLLDPTKLIPEALVPVEIVGKMVLNRNPDNYFAETEQIAFCPGNIVPGIDFSNDPLLQGRLFSYIDTQISRLGGPNFHQIPINKPVCPFHNHQRDGMHRMTIEPGANYEPNSIDNNWPRETPPSAKNGGFASYHERIDAEKIRERSPSFNEFYSQPRLFWLSQTPVEQEHIINAFSFELGKVTRPYIRERVIDLLTRVDPQLASRVADDMGVTLSDEQMKRELPNAVNGLEKDETLSLYANKEYSLNSAQVALLVADGVCGESLATLKKAFGKEGIYCKLLAPKMGMLKTRQGDEIKIDGTIEGNPSVTVDAVVVVTGDENVETLKNDGHTKHYLLEAYKHLKAIALQDKFAEMLQCPGMALEQDEGLIVEREAGPLAEALMKAMKQYRVWNREGRVDDIAA